MNYLCLYVKLHSPKACAITGDFQNIPRAHKNYEMHLILRLLLSSLTGLTVVKSTGPRLCTTLLFLMLLSMIVWPGAEGVPQRGENEICLDALVIVHRHAGWRLITLLGLTVCCLRWHWLPLLNENTAYIDHWECTSPASFFIFLFLIIFLSYSYLILIVHEFLQRLFILFILWCLLTISAVEKLSLHGRSIRAFWWWEEGQEWRLIRTLKLFSVSDTLHTAF